MRRIEGIHLMVDGYASSDKAFEQEQVLALFDTLVDALNMTYLTEPEGYHVDLQPGKLGGDEDEGGWSYFCQITTSHIAFHFWPLRKAVMLDIFSCRQFNVARAFTILDKHFGFEYYNQHVITRDDPRFGVRSEPN